MKARGIQPAASGAQETQGSPQWLALGLWIAICLGAAAIGSWLTTPALGGWYPALRKPQWTPPNWLFAPVWTIVYISMGIAVWMVWRRRAGRAVTLALALFGLQLGLNVLWSGLFFGLRSPGAALIEISVLWLAIAATAAAFHRIRPAAGWILLPYLGWVGFAVLLNFAIWHLNASVEMPP